MFLFRLLFSPIKIVLFVARVMGYNRFVVFLLGVGVGLLAAPTTGAEMREKLKAQIEARTGGVSSAPPSPKPTSSPTSTPSSSATSKSAASSPSPASQPTPPKAAEPSSDPAELTATPASDGDDAAPTVTPGA